jgi:hypothetical protein
VRNVEEKRKLSVDVQNPLLETVFTDQEVENHEVFL